MGLCEGCFAGVTTFEPLCSACVRSPLSLPLTRSAYDYDIPSDDKKTKNAKAKWTKQEVSPMQPATSSLNFYAYSHCFRLLRAAEHLAEYIRKLHFACLQDNALKEAVKKYGSNWRKVADALGGERSETQCQLRWQKVLSPNLVKGPWTKEVRCQCACVRGSPDQYYA